MKFFTHVTGTAILASLLSAPLAFADTTLADECTTRETQMVSLYYMTIMKRDDDIGAFYKNKIDEINTLAAKHDWADYQLTSQDVSISQSSYGTGMQDVTVSVSFQLAADYNTISQISKGTDAYSISSSRYAEQICPDSFDY